MAIASLADNKGFEKFITICIVINAITLGLETSDSVAASNSVMFFLTYLDKIFIGIFTLEIIVKMSAKKLSYFKDPWNIFDFIIVLISWLPALGAFSVLRALRVLRVLRIISIIPSLKQVIEGLLRAVPGLGVAFSILLLVFYIASVIATNLYSQSFPEWFGNLGSSAYTLFQVMTLESWSMGIVRPVMEKHPYAWVFFIPYIFITTFTTLNLFIGVIVNALQTQTENPSEKDETKVEASQKNALKQIQQQQEEILRLLNKQNNS